MILYDANAPGPNPVTVRLFVHERRGLQFDVETIDLVALENRKPAYRNNINARGEVPALRLDNGKIITEVTAICGYFDEIAKGGDDYSEIHPKNARRFICGRGGCISRSFFLS